MDLPTLRRECLDHVPILGERYLRRTLAGGSTRHYNGHRPHQALQQKSPQRRPSQAVDITARIERRQVLGGSTTKVPQSGLASAKRQREAPTNEFWHSTRLKLDELITRRYALDDVNQAYADMRSGVNIRGVVDFIPAG